MKVSFEVTEAVIDDYAENGDEKLLPRCIAFLCRIPIESSRIRN